MLDKCEGRVGEPVERAELFSRSDWVRLEIKAIVIGLDPREKIVPIGVASHRHGNIGCRCLCAFDKVRETTVLAHEGVELCTIVLFDYEAELGLSVVDATTLAPNKLADT